MWVLLGPVDRDDLVHPDDVARSGEPGGDAVRPGRHPHGGRRRCAFLGNSQAECEARADAVLRGDSGLLRGTLGDSIVVECEVDGDLMRATATGTFDWWIGGLPPIDVRMVGEAVIEVAP